MSAAVSADTHVVVSRSHAGAGRSRSTTHRVPWVDGQVVAEARRADPESQRVLYLAAAPRLVAFFRYSGLDRTEAEDLTSDVMERALRKLPTLRDVDAFEAWIWVIARNELAGHRRRRRRLHPALVAPPPMEPPEHAELAEEHLAISSALGRLSDRDRTLLWLREVEGLTYEEIGGRLGGASGAMRVALHRARRRLEAAYRAVTHDNDGAGAA